MSHIATVEVQIKDLEALAKACEELNLELVIGQTTYRWYGRAVGRPADARDGFCEHAIRVKGNPKAYEIGLTKRADGTGYEIKWDTWSGGFGLVAAVGGEKAEKLKQTYAAEVAAKAARRAGFRVVQRSVRSDGSIQIVTQR